jgi:RNA polymerase sigma-70 factor (ECF subfamily)
MSTAEFNQLLVGQAESLRPFAMTLTRDSENAKDLFQETVCRALMNMEKYQVGTNIKAWMFTIMRNIFINNYRKSARHRVVGEPQEIVYQGSLTPAATNNPAVDTISSKDIEKHIHSLPSIFHYPFVLYLEGYKYHEIADIVNEPLGTIKSRIHFARKLLKAQILRDGLIKN